MNAENTPEEKKAPHKRSRKRRIARSFVIIVGILVIIRLILPYVILHFLNQKLAKLDGYYGHIRDIDLALYRGAYVINDIYIDKVDRDSPQKDTTEFFKCPQIDLSVQWKAVFEKKFVGEVEFEQPVVEYTMDKTIGKKAEKDTTNFIQLVKDFVPLRINRFAVHDGQIHYKDTGGKPPVDVPMTNVNIEALHLTNQPDTSLLPASIKMTANLYDGNFSVNVRLDPLNKVPTFDLNATLTKTNIVRLNPVFMSYAGFELSSGQLSLFTEFAAKSGNFKGYVKPLMKDLKMNYEGDVKQIVWTALVGTAATILTNPKKDQVATDVPVEGKFSKPDVDVIEAIIAVLRNAFVEALRPSIDNTISIKAVPTSAPEKKSLMDRIFNKKKKKGK